MHYRPTSRTTPTRYRERARYDRDTVHRILDEALICHLGYLNAGRPVVLPTTHAQLGETLYLHGSTGSRPMRGAGAGLPVCVTATLVDGLVLARSALHHSLVYRSVVVIGDARLVDDTRRSRGRLPGCSVTSRPDVPPTAEPRTRRSSPRPRCSPSTCSRCRPRYAMVGPPTSRRITRYRTGPGWFRCA